MLHPRFTLCALVLVSIVVVAAPATAAAQTRSDPVRIEVTFVIYDEDGDHFTTAVTDESVSGKWAYGGWENNGVGSGAQSTGELLAYHFDNGIVARVTQSGAASGTATVFFVGGYGAVRYVMDSGDRGTVSFIAVPSEINVWHVKLLGPAPPIFFNNPS